jgi:glutamyl-tRNA synthetase
MKTVTRFAPSPTGYIHIGNLRSAIYPYLVAKQEQGTFILRIEDTDRARYVEGATELIEDTLKWIGLDWDEGPEKAARTVHTFRLSAKKSTSNGQRS